MEYEQLVELCARTVHETNRAYCELLHESYKHGGWESISPELQESIRDGVRKHLNNPNMTASESHESWLAYKKAQGWIYGPVKDDAAKTHPCMVPFFDLPVPQRMKDYIFSSVVAAIRRMNE